MSSCDELLLFGVASQAPELISVTLDNELERKLETSSQNAVLRCPHDKLTSSSFCNYSHRAILLWNLEIQESVFIRRNIISQCVSFTCTVAYYFMSCESFLFNANSSFLIVLFAFLHFCYGMRAYTLNMT
jgi:hypothetical protein